MIRSESIENKYFMNDDLDHLRHALNRLKTAYQLGQVELVKRNKILREIPDIIKLSNRDRLPETKALVLVLIDKALNGFESQDSLARAIKALHFGIYATESAYNKLIFKK